MSFVNPAPLLALLVLPPLLFLDVRRFARRSPAFFALVGRRSLSSRVSAAFVAGRSRLSSFLFAASVAAAVVALAGPRWGVRVVPEFRQGLDVALALDVSRSMDASDVFPSRLSRAARIAADLVEASAGIRFSVVIGKGDGVTAVPLTDDAESVFSLLSALSSGAMSSRGTDLERLVSAALGAFPESTSARRLIVLFSDGESLSGDLSAVAERAAAAGVRIAAVGMGTAAGAFVPVSGGSREILRGADGKPVLSVLDEAKLRSLSSPTGGSYFDGSAPAAAAELASFAAGLRSVSASDGFRKEPVPRYRFFLSLSVCLFFASRLAGTVRKRRPR